MPHDATLELAPGATIAGNWTLVGLLEPLGEIPAGLARGSGRGVAIVFFLPDAAPAPSLDVDQEALWGTVRRVLRDEALGRVVVDEVPDGERLSERIGQGGGAALGALAELKKRVGQAHQRGWVHGLLAADRVVCGPEGISVAGWGLIGDDTRDRVSQDQAALSALASAAGLRERGPDEPSLTGPLVVDQSPEAAALRAATRADHLPGLRQALEQWRQGGGAAEHPDARRAADALARLERKIVTHLDQAASMLQAGDPLGAVAACREAIRLGASEDEAGPLMRQARKQARRLVGGGRAPSRRMLAAGGAGAAALGLVAILVLGALRPSPEEGKARTEAMMHAARSGERGAAIWLAEQREAGQRGAWIDDLIASHLERMVQQEREKLVAQKRDAVAQGGVPQEADQLARGALAELEEVAQRRNDPALATRLKSTVVALDRAAASYRSGLRLGANDAARAVEQLVVAEAAATREDR
ncbi:MAG: hypothetical protein MUC67_08055 [Acidobacteria bacterium]|nr:hypothetical protein [Acidobacteriota bacterium]